MSQESEEMIAKAKKEVRRALEGGQMDEVIRLASAIRECQAASRNLEAAKEGLASQLSVDTQTATAGAAPYAVTVSAHTQAPSKKVKANDRRREYVHKLAGEGIQLRRVTGTVYETSGGKMVGIPFASESKKRPDKWWLGLPDRHFDFVVLLCETLTGEILDFVLPLRVVGRMWPLLSRNANQHIMHVQRSGVNYQLEPGKGLGNITQFLSASSGLR